MMDRHMALSVFCFKLFVDVKEIEVMHPRVADFNVPPLQRSTLFQPEACTYENLEE